MLRRDVSHRIRKECEIESAGRRREGNSCSIKD